MSQKRRSMGTVTPSIPIDENIERSPLLPSKSDGEQPIRKWRQSPSFVSNIILFVVVLVSFAEQIAESPETRILESVICYRHYEQSDPSKINLSRNHVGPGAIGGVDEHWCKTAAVQHSLAELNSFRLLLDGIPALLLAIPFGWAADNSRIGRWPIAFMNLVHVMLRSGWVQLVAWHWQSFDLSAIYFNTVLCLFGGGSSVVSALFYVMVSDTTRPAERAAAFLRLGATNLSAALFMPPLSAWLMGISPWIPSFLGLGLYALAAIAFLLVPETLHFRFGNPAKKPDAVPRSVERHPSGHVETTPSDLGTTSSSYRWKTKLKSSLSFLAEDLRVVALIIPFTAHILLASISKLLLQYVSTRYDLSFSKATLLVTIRNGVTVVLLFVILPYLTTAIMRTYQLSGQAKDLFLARISQILMAVGWILVAASPNIPSVALSLAIASSGVGAVFLIRSLLTSLVPAHHIARVYTSISMVDTVGLMAGAPLLAGLFSRGLVLGTGWIGLPFYFLGGLSALFAILLFFVRLNEGKEVSEEERI